MRNKICRVVVYIFGILFALALSLFLIGTFGLFGQEKDPLSGIFLIPLGLPWNRFLDGFGDAALPWLASLAPLANLLLLTVICRFFRKP